MHRFVLESAGVRGALVRLHASWCAVRDSHPYPASVSAQLGEALAAVVLLSTTIKLQGSLILQAQGDGPLHTLVAQASAGRTVRGVARWRGEVPCGELAHVFGAGRLALTTHTAQGDPYQGIVALEGDNVAAALETYFSQSEQLATRLRLATGPQVAAGILVQILPSRVTGPDDWPRIVLLSETVTADELCNLPAQTLLTRLFHDEQVRMFESEPVAFRCTCSRTRIARTLAAIGHAHLDGLADERGELEVTCEFCNRSYRFDRVDVEHALTEGVHIDSPDRVQ